MSDTPRTDAAYFKPHATMYDLAREMKFMERELNAANEMFRKLNIHALNLTDRIRRLEDAGDDLHDGWRGNRNNKDKYLWAWHKAKEAKP